MDSAAGESELPNALLAQIAATGIKATLKARISDVAFLFDIPVTSQLGATLLGGTVGSGAQETLNGVTMADAP